jgi:methyltransferase (TIGR00027 family)
MPELGLRRAAIGSTIFFIAAPGGVAGLAPFLISGWRRASGVPAGVRVVGAGLVLAGLLLLVECFVRFVVHGHGTPAPVAPPTRLVVSGLYRYVRNPMYVAVVVVVVGQAAWFGSSALLVYAVVLWGLFHLRVVVYEEPTLLREFGASFEEYRRGVGRWRPRLTPWRSGQRVLLPPCQKMLQETGMSETTYRDLSGVAETSLITLYIRAIESRRPDALIRDENAVALVGLMDQGFLQKKLTRIKEYSQVALVLRTREFDRFTRDFLARHPEAVVVHIGCGLDSRFERVDNGRVDWYDLDLPDVMALRRKYIGGEGVRHHPLACSVLDGSWPSRMSADRQGPVLFLAEGVLMYFDEAQVKSLVLTLKDRFPGAELVFDAFSPFLVWANNLRVALSKIGARTHWALRHGKDLERWSDGVCLLDEWFPFKCPEPRLGRARLARHIPFFAKTMGVFHYRLGGSKNLVEHAITAPGSRW